MILLEQQGLQDVALPCASCFSRFRSAAHELRQDPDLKDDLSQELDYEYQDSLNIFSLIEFLNQRVGMERIGTQVVKPLEGLKVACYYGCLLTRPPSITDAEPVEAEYPMAMDRILKTLGATPIDWDFKTSCCGAALSISFTEIVHDMTRGILENAQARGADVIAVACPLCHLNLDGRQTQMEHAPNMPAVYFTQLMSLAFGLEREAMLSRVVIDPKPMLVERGLL
jgi:heterodisulfide reductase subunit B